MSKELAQYRKETVSDLRYKLEFDLTSKNLASSATVSFLLEEPCDVIFDFTGKTDSVSVNGKNVENAVLPEHIFIPAEYTMSGMNVVDIGFEAGNGSMNIRDGYLYTLLVPDRARTLFPCMDQPDLKGRFMLKLIVPSDWTAVSNSAVMTEDFSDSGKAVSFMETKPLSTYLFSFVAGEFQKVTMESDGRQVSMYHRETDPVKVAECPDIMSLVFSALSFMEEYTGIEYPFGKYDFVVIPDFQYGGMEHAGATLYNDRRIFLGSSPTTTELLDRQSLISHETAHMWFGDFVTMKWFDDVWIKEVFANWFAARMARPSFPEINHTLSDLGEYFVSAYQEDRTDAANAISRPLENLNHAGLIYCNTIYDKSPIVMDKLFQKLGEERFRKGISEYLRTYAYSNASWDDLVAILCPELKQWCDMWITTPGMPVYTSEISGNHVEITCNGPWEQNLTCRAVSEDGRIEDFTSASFDAGFKVSYVIPNIDGLGYGYFPVGKELFDVYPSLGETERMSLLMSLYESTVRGGIDEEDFLSFAVSRLPSEENPIIFEYSLDCISKLSLYCEISEESERILHHFATTTKDAERRLLALRCLYAVSCHDRIYDSLYGIWHEDTYSLPERDLTGMSYELMIRFPDRYEEIKSVQRSRITNPDRVLTFDYVSIAASPDSAVRDSLFLSFSNPGGRRPESRVLSALKLLSHFTREEYSRKYILPGLELLPEIQRTGDIFFPASWCRALLSGHPYSRDEVESFVDSNRQLSPLLMTKIRQASMYR